MPAPEHADILSHGTDTWNRWREAQPGLVPDLHGIELSGRDLRGLNLRRADLHGADLSGTDLSRADLSRANLIESDLYDCRLAEANLNRADLIWANLGQADLRQANLSGADLSEAHLLSASLRGANLIGANLSGADLRRADLRETNLCRSVINRARLEGLDLGGARLGWVSFADLDLSDVQGFESATFIGPCTVGTDTISRSGGHLPEALLAGAGVAEPFRSAARSLAQQPFAYYTCFISCSRHDQAFCRRLRTDLLSRGVRAWPFPEDSNLTASIWAETDKSLRIYDKLVVVCSRHALQSDSVLLEIERVLSRQEHDGQPILFPIAIDDYLFDQWNHPRKAQLQDHLVADFRGWQQDETRYPSALEALVAALGGT